MTTYASIDHANSDRVKSEIPYGRLAFVSVLWISLVAASCYLYDRAEEVGGTMSWLAILHPVLFGLTVWPILRSYWQGRDWYRISNAVLVLIYVYMGFGSANYILTYDTIDPRSLKQADYAAEGMLLVLLGTLAYRLGAEGPWLSRLTRRLPLLPPTPRWSNALSVGIAAAVLFSLSLALLEMGLGTFGYGGEAFAVPSYLSALRYLSKVSLIGLTVGFFYWSAGAPLTNTDKRLLVGCCCLLLALSLLTGMKSNSMMVVLFSGVPYLLLRVHGMARVEPSRSLVVVGALLIILLFAINPLYRDALNAAGGTKHRIDVADEMIDEVTSGFDNAFADDGVLLSGLNNFAGRVTLYGYFLVALRKTPEPHEFRHWDRYPGILMTALIPRTVWPDKPTHMEGGKFQHKYVSQRVANSTTPTVFGWAYIEGGKVAVVLLLFLLGLCARFVQLYAVGKHGVTLASTVLFTYGIQAFMTCLEGDPFWVLNGIPKEAATCAAGYCAIVSLPRWLLGRT